MEFRSTLSALILLFTLQAGACQSWGKFWCTPDATSVECVSVTINPGNAGNAVWAAGVTAAPSTSNFNAVTTDSAGNVYVAGQQNTTGSFTYGTQSIAGLGSPNVVLVKYDANGSVQWAKTTSGGNNINYFTAVAVDSAGNVYAAGIQSVTVTYTYGTVTATGACNVGYNAVIVKYDSAGTALWARSSGTAGIPSTAPAPLAYSGVAVDNTGNIYAVGGLGTNGTYVFGSQSTTSAFAGNNAFIVKYDSAGNVLWARSTAAATVASQFSAVATDNAGNVYAAGFQTGNGSNTYGTQSTAGSNAGGNNVLLVKYDVGGNALWARSTVSGSTLSAFNSVATDSAGNIFSAGFQAGPGSVTYGSVTVAGVNATGNTLLVKYDTTGNTAWAKTASAAADVSGFNAVTADSYGYVYAAGIQVGNGTFSYDSQSVTASYGGGSNALLVKYSPSGNALWARTPSAGVNVSQFAGVRADTSGKLYAVGQQSGNTAFTYGSKNITTPFAAGSNSLIVAYE